MGNQETMPDRIVRQNIHLPENLQNQNTPVKYNTSNLAQQYKDYQKQLQQQQAKRLEQQQQQQQQLQEQQQKLILQQQNLQQLNQHNQTKVNQKETTSTPNKQQGQKDNDPVTKVFIANNFLKNQNAEKKQFLDTLQFGSQPQFQEQEKVEQQQHYQQLLNLEQIQDNNSNQMNFQVLQSPIISMNPLDLNQRPVVVQEQQFPQQVPQLSNSLIFQQTYQGDQPFLSPNQMQPQLQYQNEIQQILPQQYKTNKVIENSPLTHQQPFIQTQVIEPIQVYTASDFQQQQQFHQNKLNQIQEPQFLNIQQSPPIQILSNSQIFMTGQQYATTIPSIQEQNNATFLQQQEISEPSQNKNQTTHQETQKQAGKKSPKNKSQMLDNKLQQQQDFQNTFNNSFYNPPTTVAANFYSSTEGFYKPQQQQQFADQPQQQQILQNQQPNIKIVQITQPQQSQQQQQQQQQKSQEQAQPIRKNTFDVFDNDKYNKQNTRSSALFTQGARFMSKGELVYQPPTITHLSFSPLDSNYKIIKNQIALSRTNNKTLKDQPQFLQQPPMFLYQNQQPQQQLENNNIPPLNPQANNPNVVPKILAPQKQQIQIVQQIITNNQAQSYAIPYSLPQQQQQLTQQQTFQQNLQDNSHFKIQPHQYIEQQPQQQQFNVQHQHPLQQIVYLGQQQQQKPPQQLIQQLENLQIDNQQKQINNEPIVLQNIHTQQQFNQTFSGQFTYNPTPAPVILQSVQVQPQVFQTSKNNFYENKNKQNDNLTQIQPQSRQENQKQAGKLVNNSNNLPENLQVNRTLDFSNNNDNPQNNVLDKNNVQQQQQQQTNENDLQQTAESLDERLEKVLQRSQALTNALLQSQKKNLNKIIEYHNEANSKKDNQSQQQKEE